MTPISLFGRRIDHDVVVGVCNDVGATDAFVWVPCLENGAAAVPGAICIPPVVMDCEPFQNMGWGIVFEFLGHKGFCHVEGRYVWLIVHVEGHSTLVHQPGICGDMLYDDAGTVEGNGTVFRRIGDGLSCVVLPGEAVVIAVCIV